MQVEILDNCFGHLGSNASLQVKHGESLLLVKLHISHVLEQFSLRNLVLVSFSQK